MTTARLLAVWEGIGGTKWKEMVMNDLRDLVIRFREGMVTRRDLKQLERGGRVETNLTSRTGMKTKMN